MAGDGRTAEESLIKRLEESPYGFDFFQVVRRLECEHPDQPRVGASQKPAQDPIRFGQEPSLAFAPTALSRLKRSSNTGQAKLLVHFMGLLGPNGPMPLHITQYIRDRVHNEHDQTFAAFLDMFHHRVISLFYRAWATCQPTVNRDRPEDDRLAEYVDSLIGLGLESMTERDSVQDDAKRFFTGRLSLQTRNSEGLAAILGDYFQVPVQIDEFVGHWVELPPDYQCKLGESPTTGCLGQTTLMGGRYWDIQQKFRIRIGPLPIEQYMHFLPDGRSYPRLRDWVRNYIGLHLKWELQLSLKPRQVPKMQLGTEGKLGWTTWLSTQDFERPAEDLTLQPLTP